MKDLKLFHLVKKELKFLLLKNLFKFYHKKWLHSKRKFIIIMYINKETIELLSSNQKEMSSIIHLDMLHQIAINSLKEINNLSTI